MSSSRALEVFFGVVTLVSVVSVPVPQKSPPAVVVPARPRLDLTRLEYLHRESLAQKESVSSLSRETRELSNLLRTQPIRSDGGTVASHAPRTGIQPENEEYECSQ